jgi:polysaccharide biosynthesis protein PslH
MKILVLSPHIPAPMAGASTRIYHIVKALASQHEVTLLTLNESIIEGVQRNQGELSRFVKSMQIIEESRSRSKRWDQLSAVLHGRSYLLTRSILPEMQKAIEDVIRQEKCDVVVCESVMLAGYHFPPGVRLVIDQHNLEYEICWRTYQREKFGTRKLYSWLEARKLKPEELRRCGNADLVLVTSERECIELKRQVPSCVVAQVPNGVDTTFFQSASSEKEIAYRLVFTGSMDYYPNTDAALHFAKHCWPLVQSQLPQATWTIVGKNPPSQIQQLASLPGVTVTGSVPDVRPYLEEAALAIAPLLIGGGTRLKILEALAMQKAVVSTSLGCEGLHVESGRELVIANEPEDLAAAIVRLLQDAASRETLAVAGRKLVEAEYSWEEAGRRLLHHLDTW